jgi:hypothetical protein
MPLRFSAVLRAEGIDPADVRLLRHQDTRAGATSLYQLWLHDRDRFEAYQSWQPARLEAALRAKYWAAFVKDFDDATVFVGLYTVNAKRPAPVQATTNPLSGAAVNEPGLIYDLTPVPELAGVAGRLCIDWGSGTRARVQRADLRDKLILELRREVRERPFPGYLAFCSPLTALETLPAAWRTALAQARGIYLLTCPKTREQYVGSAAGIDGFLGRWQEYVRNGHGGNVALKSRDASDYQVSILEQVGSAASSEDILALESLWKAKLQSREMGLNRNG